MDIGLKINRNFIIFGVPVALFGILTLLIKSTFFNKNELLPLALSIDLILIVPLIYFLLIRKKNIPKTTVIPIMLIGLLIGSYILPKEDQNFITLFKNWALPLIELSVLTLVMVKLRAAVKKYKDNKDTTTDFYDALKNSCYEILPQKLVMPFATEIAVLYYGFFSWKSKETQDNEFSYHKKSGTQALFGAFIFIIGVETIALHFLLVQWSAIAAWILTVLSIYTAIQVLGFAKSLSKRFISINQDSLALKYGIMNESKIPLGNIEKIELSRKAPEKNTLTQWLSPLGEIESHNVIIHLDKENELLGIYGIRKKYKVLALYIDEPKKFMEKLENVL